MHVKYDAPILQQFKLENLWSVMSPMFSNVFCTNYDIKLCFNKTMCNGCIASDTNGMVNVRLIIYLFRLAVMPILEMHSARSNYEVGF